MDWYFEIQHFVHPEHPLTLVDLKDSETRSLIESHKKSNREKQRSDRLRQGLSDSDEEEEKLDVSISCVLCHNEMVETSYSCTICDIHLHKLCAEFPTQMIHPSHTEHPLTLTDRRSFKCDICSKSENGFSYFCRSCDFDVDVKCASRAEAIDHNGHPHPLYPVLRPSLFKCDACDTEHAAAGVSYMCNTCDFWVHEDCATLPATVKYHHHVHPLSLVVYSTPLNLKSMKCAICKDRIKTPWMYECKGCGHVVDVNCLATTLNAERNKTYEVDAEIDRTKLFQLPESFKSYDLVAQMIKHIAIHYGDNTSLSEVGHLISHFSHKHPLTLLIRNLPSNNNEYGGGRRKKVDVICNACVLPISAPTVYYSCTTCNNYVLHEWCAKLPNELQHPSDEHPLILMGPGRIKSGLTRCLTRKCYSNGFSYRCRDTVAPCSWFAMDIKCLLPPAISHKAHKHPLKLVQSCMEEGCVACPGFRTSLAYGCVSCCFYLHHECALKPITIVHRYDKHHPFISTSVQPIENQDDEYVCEFCEKDIDPNWWFHHCFHCDLSACSHCIFPKWKSHVNVHLTYSSDIHDHPLSYVRVDITNNTSLCPRCEKDFAYDEYALQCAQCKVMFHNENCSEDSPESLFPLVLQEGPSYPQ